MLRTIILVYLLCVGTSTLVIGGFLWQLLMSEGEVSKPKAAMPWLICATGAFITGLSLWLMS